MKILIAYGSSHGHTARIAARIGARMLNQGHEVVIADHLLGLRAEDFDAIILGGRVHGSRYPWRVTHFIRRNLRTLRARPSAFFSVSLLQLSRFRKQRDKTEALPRTTTAKLGWTPDRVAVFGGALRWKAQYGRLAPLAVWMWRYTLGTLIDPTRSEQVFTDWEAVDRFADAVLARVPDQASAGPTSLRAET